MGIDFDPLEARQLDDPYPIYRALRDDAPCQQAPSGVWTVSRYEDVMRVLKTPEIFSSRAMLSVLLRIVRDDSSGPSLEGLYFMARAWWKIRMSPTAIVWARAMIGEDGESHHQLRTIVNRAFTPQRVAAHEARMRAIVDECVASFFRGEEFDLVRDLAVPLPVTIIAELLGVDSDRISDFKRWSHIAVSVISGPIGAEPPTREAQDALIEMLAYFRQCAKRRRKSPSDDLISALVTSTSGEDVLSDAEVVIFSVMLLLAGNETTTNLIGNASLALLRNRSQLAMLEADPALIESAIEETVRYDSPIQTLFRITTRDTEIAGTRIAKGETVAILLGSANRDERRFSEPDRFDITRDTRGHVGFGFGPHFCLGASLARLEGRLALERLVDVLAELEPPDRPVERQDSFLVRGPLSLGLDRRVERSA
jgi:cytochrome P450